MRLASAFVLVVALSIGAVGILFGSRVAGAGDAFGYLSEATLIASGTLHIEQQFVRALPWPFADWSFAPAGYRPGTSRGTIVPTYPAGLPLVMAAFRRVGGPDAMFYVVPLFGALCVWMTGRLGTLVHGPLTGALSALMVAVSPSFLYQLMQPLSDVPAAAWWTTSLVLALGSGPLAAAASGLATSAAILTRPNLVPLAAVIAGLYLARVLHASGDRRRPAIELLCFAGLVLPGCIAVAIINDRLYGSPLLSGYEPFDALYQLANLGPNLDRYPRWLMQTQTPFVGLALVAPWLYHRMPAPDMERAPRRDRLLLLWWFAAAVCLSYLFYVPFGRDEWACLRFLLPAYPAVIVLAVAAATDLARRLAPRRATAVAMVLCIAVSAWVAREAFHRGFMNVAPVERRYEDVGRYVNALMPANGVFIGHLHGGSIRYYSGRLTINYQWLPPRWLDAAVTALEERGYHPMIVLDEGEVDDFRRRFGALNGLGRLDWPPAAERTDPVRVRVYDPADRARFQRGETIATRPIESRAVR